MLVIDTDSRRPADGNGWGEAEPAATKLECIQSSLTEPKKPRCFWLGEDSSPRDRSSCGSFGRVSAGLLSLPLGATHGRRAAEFCPAWSSGSFVRAGLLSVPPAETRAGGWCYNCRGPAHEPIVSSSGGPFALLPLVLHPCLPPDPPDLRLRGTRYARPRRTARPPISTPASTPTAGHPQPVVGTCPGLSLADSTLLPPNPPPTERHPPTPMADHDIEKAQGPPENGSQSSETRHGEHEGAYILPSALPDLYPQPQVEVEHADRRLSFPLPSARSRSPTEYGTRGDEGGGDEYSNLLRFVQESAENRRGGGGGGGDDDGRYSKIHRVWYAPWKRYEVVYDKNGQKVGEEQFRVPEQWCAAPSLPWPGRPPQREPNMGCAGSEPTSPAVWTRATLLAGVARPAGTSSRPSGKTSSSNSCSVRLRPWKQDQSPY